MKVHSNLSVAVIVGVLAMVLLRFPLASLAQTAVPDISTTPSDASASAQPASASSSIYTADIDVKRQTELAKLYQSLIEDYGVKSRLFTLNRAQWQSIQTLRSLEEAVLATNAVLIARDKTMITYFELLLEVLGKTPGIELTLKEKNLATLTKRVEWLRAHEEKTVTAVDRDSVNARADEYTLEADIISAEAYQALMLIRLGRLQTTFDRSNGLYERIVERNVQEKGTPIQEVERSRAYAQVDLLKAEIQTELRLSRELLEDESSVQNNIATVYNNFIDSLNSPYGKNSKYLSFLEELARDTW